jgi:hypothetical protein
MPLSRKREEILDSMSSEDLFRCFTQRFACAHLPAPHMTRSIGRAFRNVHHRGHWTEAAYGCLKV